MKILNLIKIILLSAILAPILIASAGFFDDLKGTGEAQKLKKACEKKDAKACYQAGDMFSKNPSEAAKKEGIRMFTMGCDLGNLESCEYLAGKGDLKMAFKAGQLSNNKDGRKKWFGKVCLEGDVKGCEALCTRGLFDENLDGCMKLAEIAGKNSPSNEANDEEIKWWLKACDNGNTSGCLNAGQFTKDPNESSKLIEKACTSKDPAGCYILGFRAKERGDLKSAENYYLLSCKDFFYEDSCEILKGIRNEIADTGNKEAMAKQAPILAQLKAGCDKGDKNECFKLGRRYEEFNNPNEAIDSYIKACDGGPSEGCFGAGMLLQKRNKLAEAKKYILLGCERGHPLACNNLGNMEIQKGNQAEAVKFYTKACDGGNPTGCTNLASIQIDWANITEARKYLNIACDSGSNAACQKLVALTKTGM